MSKTIYHSTLKNDGPFKVKVNGDAHKCAWTDKYTHEPVYSVKLEVNGEEKYYSTDKKVAEYLASFKGQEVTLSAEPNNRIKIEGGDNKTEGAVTTEEVKARVPKKAAVKEDYWQRKEERDIEYMKRQLASQPRIERQHSQQMAIEAFSHIPLSLLPEGTIASLDNLRAFVTKLTDHFQKDLNNQPDL